MLKWAFVFLLIAIVAGIFGFTGVEAGLRHHRAMAVRHFPGAVYRRAGDRPGDRRQADVVIAATRPRSRDSALSWMNCRRGSTRSPISWSNSTLASSHFLDADLQQRARIDVERGLPQLLGVHLAQPFVALHGDALAPGAGERFEQADRPVNRRWSRPCGAASPAASGAGKSAAARARIRRACARRPSRAAPGR